MHDDSKPNYLLLIVIVFLVLAVMAGLYFRLPYFHKYNIDVPRLNAVNK